MWGTTAAASLRTVFPVVLAQKKRVKRQRDKRRTRGRSHPREQQPADWPFYRADWSRLYEESHNGNLRSSLPSLLPLSSRRPLTPRGLTSFVSCAPSSPSSSLHFPLHIFCLLFLACDVFEECLRSNDEKLIGEETKRINAD